MRFMPLCACTSNAPTGSHVGWTRTTVTRITARRAEWKTIVVAPSLLSGRTVGRVERTARRSSTPDRERVTTNGAGPPPPLAPLN
jgi:hypothetical protein